MKILPFYKWVQYYIPVGLTLFMLVTVKWTVTTDGAYDRLCGFPFPYISNYYACTGCFEVYIGAALFDLSIYLVFILLLFKGLKKLGLKLKFHWVPTIIGLLISAMWLSLFFLFNQDSFFEVVNHIDYKTKRMEIVFGQIP